MARSGEHEVKSIMVDLETLGTGVNSCIISIGVVAFDADKGVLASEGWAIRHQDWHGKKDPDTIKWWMKQNEAAQDYSFGGTTTALTAANGFRDFHAAWGGDECWANDPDFDIVLLKQWWSRIVAETGWSLGKFPIRYNEGRSFRTLTGEAKRLGIDYSHIYGSATVAHHPVDDAVNQARVVNYIRNQLVKAAA
jgi:hypothetical protein